MPVGTDYAQLVPQNRLEIQTVGFLKGSLQQRQGHFKADKIVVTVGSIPSLRNLEHVESEFGFYVGKGIIFIRCHAPVFLFDFRVQHRYGEVRRQAMAIIVRCVMCHGSDRKSVFIQILRIFQQCFNKITASKVVGEIAKEFIAVRVVTHILNDGSPVGVSMSLTEIIGRGIGKSMEEERANARLPGRINDGFVG